MFLTNLHDCFWKYKIFTTATENFKSETSPIHWFAGFSFISVCCITNCFYIFSEESVRAELKKLPLVPTSALREHPSISYW